MNCEQFDSGMVCTSADANFWIGFIGLVLVFWSIGMVMRLVGKMIFRAWEMYMAKRAARQLLHGVRARFAASKEKEDANDASDFDTDSRD